MLSYPHEPDHAALPMSRIAATRVSGYEKTVAVDPDGALPASGVGRDHAAGVASWPRSRIDRARTRYCQRMTLLAFLIVLALIGLFVGALGRLVLPGPDPMGIGATILVGLAGSFAAGLFSWYVLHRHGAGLLLSLAFTVVILALIRATRGQRP